MTRTLTFTLPYPPRELFPNARVNRRWQHQPKTLYAAWVWLSLRVALGPQPWPRFERARMDITAVYPNRQGIADSDNLIAAFKYGRDMFGDWSATIAGETYRETSLLPDDSPRHLVLGSVGVEIDRREKERSLVVTLTELPASGPGRAAGADGEGQE